MIFGSNKIVPLTSATNCKTRKCSNTNYILNNTGQATLCVLKFVAVLLCLTFLFSFTLKQRQMNNSIEVIRKINFVKWKEIDRFQDYYVSNTGLVRYKKRIMVQKTHKGNGRLQVNLRSEKLYITQYVHIIVWRHFGSDIILNGYEIHHKDGNFLNNNILNLAYLPMKEHKAIHWG